MFQRENGKNTEPSLPAARPAAGIWKEWRFLLFLFVLFFVLTLSSALLVMKVSLGGGGSAVPGVTGKTVSQATAALARKGFLLKQEGTAFDEKIPAGYVLSQAPAEGENLKKGRVVRVFVSSGPARVLIPDLCGRPAREAEITLRESRLRMGEICKVPSSQAEAGTVIAQSPAGGVSAGRETRVHLVVSNGRIPPTFVMPDLTLRSWPEVHARLARYRIFLGRVTTENRSDVAKQSVVSQTPKYGEKVPEASFVSLKIAVPTEEREASFVKIPYSVPEEGKEKRVRIVVIDEKGSREIFNDMVSSGRTISPSAGLYGQTLAQFFVNNGLVEEKWIQTAP